MGYQMIYGQVKQPKQGSQRLRIQTFIAVCMLLFAIAVRTFWTPGAEKLRDYLLPGDLTVTEEAFSVLLVNLRAGEPMGDAVAVFCRTVVNGEN